MIANQASLLTLLEGKKQFVIPIYQRTYSWREKQCHQLWNDLVRTAQNPDTPAHFIGSIVCIKTETTPTQPLQMLVIDGQQRLTTLTLLLVALRNALDSGKYQSELSAEEVTGYIVNKFVKDDLKHKLVLTQTDKSTLGAIIDASPIPTPNSYRVLANYRFFESRIATSSIAPEIIFHGIQKLMFVDIALDKTHDNPQLIFESLNSTGLDLSQADLIRNFVLMGQEPERQTSLYKDYWYPMEQKFSQNSDTTLFDRFMRDYLTIKLRRIPNIREVYDEFKAYSHKHSGTTVEESVADVSKFADCFMKLVSGTETDKQLRQAISDINTLKVDVAYPFLMEVYIDYVERRIGRLDFLGVLRLIESYVFRRTICSLPTNTLNKMFATLHDSIDLDRYLESLEGALMHKASNRLFPRDDEFRRNLMERDIYHMRIRNYLLGKLENHDRHEIVNIDEYTIEHIMPQSSTMPSVWISDLGEDWERVHQTYLHTLGNLTLTGYNSEYSNRPFIEKRDYKNGSNCGFRHSPLHLNEELRQLDTWNKAEIVRRAQILANRAVKIWRCPQGGDATTEDIHQEPAQAFLPEEYFGEWASVFDEFRSRLFDRNPEIREWYKKDYMGYHMADKWIFCINPQDKHMRFDINAKYSSLVDPLGVAFDASCKYHGGWTANRTIAYVKSDDNLDELLEIVQQVIDSPDDAGQSSDALEAVAAPLKTGNSVVDAFGQWSSLYEALSAGVREAAPNLVEELRTNGAVFRLGSNWVMSIWPQRTRLKIFVEVPYPELSDPDHLAVPASQIHKSADWAARFSAVFLKSTDHVDGLIRLVEQAVERIMNTR